jgi:dihydrofolate reductase
VRNLKSYKHPEKNIMLRHLTERQLFGEHSRKEALLNQESPDYVMVDSLGINSSTRQDDVKWPLLTRWNSYDPYAKEPNAKIKEGQAPEEQEWFRRNVIEKLLGRGAWNWIPGPETLMTSVKCVEMHTSKIWIGRSRYGTMHRERRSALSTWHSYFAVKAEDVPGFRDPIRLRYRTRLEENQLLPADEIDQADAEAKAVMERELLNGGFLYGRFRSFILQAIDWQREPGTAPYDPFNIGRCDFYKVIGRDEVTKLDSIDTSKVLPGIEFVELKKIAGPIALGPVVTGWDGRNAQDLKRAGTQWVVMPIKK